LRVGAILVNHIAKFELARITHALI